MPRCIAKMPTAKAEKRDIYPRIFRWTFRVVVLVVVTTSNWQRQRVRPGTVPSHCTET